MSQDIYNQHKLNMNYFKHHLPDIYNDILNVDTSNLGIHTSQFGVNIDISGNMIYPTDINSFIKKQVDTFLKKPNNIYIPPYKHVYGYNMDIHNELIHKIEAITPFNNNEFQRYCINKNIDSLPFLIISGIGNGKHIEDLLTKIDVKHLIITDSCYSFFHASTYIVNWEKIINHFSKPGYKISFFINNQAFKIAYSIINQLYYESPYKTYFIPYFIHNNNKFFEEVEKHIKDKLSIAVQGLGFIDDELISLKRTLKNLQHNIPVYTGSNDIPAKSTLFIVASGPSIDNDIKYIKQHKEDVVIFSCGTALRVLEKNGIVPDFHFEIERGIDTHNVIYKHSSKEFRSDTTLIGLNVLHTKVFTEDFKKSYLYFRASDSGSTIAPNDLPKLFNTNPTATNGAISFASEFTWHKVYMFGVDIGFKDKKNHHSKDTFHYIGDKEGTKYHNFFNRKISSIQSSNFGKEQVYSTNILSWSKERIINVLIDKTFVIHNCSDGAKIKYTLPFRAKNIVIERSSKQEAIKAIKNNFKDLKTNEPKFTQNYLKEKQNYSDLVDDFVKIISEYNVKTYSDIFQLLDKSFLLLTPKDRINNQGQYNTRHLGINLLRGTIATCYTLIYTHAMGTYHMEKVKKFIKETMIILIDFLNYSKRYIETYKID